jgi:hypothetical protein
MVYRASEVTPVSFSLSFFIPRFRGYDYKERADVTEERGASIFSVEE